VAMGVGEEVRLHDVASGKELFRLGPVKAVIDAPKNDDPAPAPRPVAVRCPAFAPGGRLAVRAAPVGPAFDLARRREPFSAVLDPSRDAERRTRVAALAFSPDGESLAAASTVWEWSYGPYGASSGSGAAVFDGRTGREMCRFSGVDAGANA